MNEFLANRPLPNIEYVAYFDGKAIARDEWGDLYYQEIPEDFVEIGEVARIEDINPLSELSEDKQQDIIEYLG